MSHYLISGGTGMLGKKISTLLLSHGHKVSILTTQKNKYQNTQDINYYYWNPSQQHIEIEHLSEKVICINLAGASVADKRWTKNRKKEILESRVNALKTLLLYHSKNIIQIEYLLSASAIGYYNSQNILHHEESENGKDFLAAVCKQWETAALQFAKINVPLSIPRIGVVWDKYGGAFPKLLHSVLVRIAPLPGNGKGILSWIHIDDLCAMVYFLCQNKMTGVWNAVAPMPINYCTFYNEIEKTINKKLLKVNVPMWILKMIMGEMAQAITASKNVSADKIIQSGFTFQYQNSLSAIKDLIQNKL